MSFYFLEPEVAGGLGEFTIIDRSVFPPAVTSLHYVFDGWLGDDILESFPCFIVTDRLASGLVERRFSGIALDTVHITVSAQFRQDHPDRQLPHFNWLRVHGRAQLDDFGLGEDNRLVVSERAFNLMRQFCLEHCDVEAT
jgi:hypothetical protein